MFYHLTSLLSYAFDIIWPEMFFCNGIFYFFICVGVSGASSHLTEELVTTMSPTAAAVAKIIKPGMKLTEVLSHFQNCVMPYCKILIKKKESGKHIWKIAFCYSFCGTNV